MPLKAAAGIWPARAPSRSISRWTSFASYVLPDAVRAAAETEAPFKFGVDIDMMSARTKGDIGEEQ